MVLKSENQKGFVNIVEDEKKIKENIVFNQFLYGLENMMQNNEIMLNMQDLFGRNIGNKKFYSEFCDRIIEARGKEKTLYEYKDFSNLIYLTNIIELIIENIKDE